jgi:large subunit ribosomal protein L19
MNKQTILNKIAQEQIRDDLSKFNVGDTIAVTTKIIDGNKVRLQKLIGVVIRFNGGGLNQTFIIRRETVGVGNEITYRLHSPLIVKIQVMKKGLVRRAYISYMRKRTGKSARIKSALINQDKNHVEPSTQK